MPRRRASSEGRRHTLGRAAVPGFFLAAVYFAVFGGEYSVFELGRARSSVEVERERLGQVTAEIDSLAAWADSLETDAATIERVAREDFGMIRDGETLYRFADSEPGLTEAQAPER